MDRYVKNLVTEDGAFPVAARLVLLGVYAVAAIRLAGDGELWMLPLLLIVLLALLRWLTGERRMLFWALLAPDWPLWHAVDGLRWWRRVGLALVNHVLLGALVLPIASQGVAGAGWLVLLPVAASGLQYVLLRPRVARSG